MPEIQTELVNLEIENYKIVLSKVCNVDSLYEDLISKGEDHEDVRDERIPYWAELWPSSIGLAKYLIKTFPDLNNKKLLEIGCGLGLAGITAGLLGAEVVLSDYLKDSIILAGSNWRLNINAEPKLVLMDWRKPDLNYNSDIILASDVLYEKRSHNYLLQFFKAMLNKDGYVLLADPQRSATKEFVNSMTHEFSIEKKSTETVEYNGMTNLIDIYRIITT